MSAFFDKSGVQLFGVALSSRSLSTAYNPPRLFFLGQMMVDRGVVGVQLMYQPRSPFVEDSPTIDRFVYSLARPDPRE